MPDAVAKAVGDVGRPWYELPLDPVLKDSDGIPAPKIDYTVSANTHHMMEHGIARAEEILRAAGAELEYDEIEVGEKVYLAGNSSGISKSAWDIIRTNKIPFVESKPSPLLVVTSTLICIVGIALPYTSIGSALDMSPLPESYWIGLAVILSSYLALTFLIKRWLINHHLIH